MDPQRHRAPLPDFFAAVRRRHPDVDIVLLPPEAPQQPKAPAAEPREPAEEAELDATLDRVATCADLLWSRVVGDRQEAQTRVGFGRRPGTVVAAARHSAQVPPDPAPLDLLQELLAADGWRLRRLAGDAVRVVGDRPGLRLTASYAPATGAFVLEVVGDPLPVGAARARGLVTRCR